MLNNCNGTLIILEALEDHFDPPLTCRNAICSQRLGWMSLAEATTRPGSWTRSMRRHRARHGWSRGIVSLFGRRGSRCRLRVGVLDGQLVRVWNYGINRLRRRVSLCKKKKKKTALSLRHQEICNLFHLRSSSPCGPKLGFRGCVHPVPTCGLCASSAVWPHPTLTRTTRGNHKHTR